ncbi:LysR family transcriptional regulator [Streptomyces sp. SID8379]|uniref:LysR substrate-binding domain-containing protein n=1 Tax=unclassified Streptomyces TaxID=2593676 RepID=UPI00038233E9|nr:MULTISPECIES: LysR substrate-binding domain-containing protein [unclassified Streptomyces]MYW62546.1 LysR family transcriptional regulator [Streptomyces sp. SID8379]
MFTLTQLTCFLAVAEELHFTRAAARLSMTQPPLSRQIQLLEHELGVRLLDRTNRTVRLTPAGRSFLGEARRIVRQAEHAALSVRQVSTGESGSIAIGFTAASAYSALGALLATSRSALPGVEILLHELVSRDQMEALGEGSLDLGLIRPTAIGADLTSRTAVREGLVAALPADHPLATGGDGPLELAAFQGQEFLMYSSVEARYFHELLLTTFHSAGVRPVFVQYLSQVHSILALVNYGWGVALVPEAAASMRYAGIVYRPLHLPDDPHPVELDFVWRKDNDNPALTALLELL